MRRGKPIEKEPFVELEELAEADEAWVDWSLPEDRCDAEAAAHEWVDAYEV